MKKKALEDELEDLEGKLQRAEKLLSGIAHIAASDCGVHGNIHQCHMPYGSSAESNTSR